MMNIGIMENFKENPSVEYLFLDAEWNQSLGTTGIENRELRQIGIVATDKNFREIRRFSETICLNHLDLLNEDSIAILHMSRRNVVQGKSEKEVLEKIRKLFLKYRYLVVWTRETYALLSLRMKANAIPMGRHTCIVLQDVLKVAVADGKRQIGFTKALKREGIDFRKKNLHNAAYDVKCLRSLFQKCYEDYQKQSKDECCVINPVSKKLHTMDCRYVEKMNPETRQNISKAKGLIFHGYTVCKACGCESEWKRLNWHLEQEVSKPKETRKSMKDLPLTDENISMICDKFHLTHTIRQDLVFIQTSFSRWIICLQEDWVKRLLHENHKRSRSEAGKQSKMKCMEGYHKQKLLSNNFYDVVSYIKYHDTEAMKRLSQKSRIEKLFERIKMEEGANCV